ncbi:gamma-glutamylcyclotransferase-like [Microplitis mediator]|uniref:gamma-glutamylcyclotransferase-like n=1 Tax=Microplitis mediator TaxID=375433 RepID=UPI002555F5A4|nr:gamma-glutamylcyclotransferase-like [Microplitis mediator]
MRQVLYFAYGSNLLKSRIKINNPSATLKDIGRIEDYRLDFVGYSNLWKGSPATIVETKNYHVWGAIWELNVDDIKHLDKQETDYHAFQVDVVNPDGKIYNCRVYQQIKCPEDNVKLENLPEIRRPALTYLKIIIKGALDCKLPNYYIDIIRKIKHNEFMDENSIIGKELQHVL